MSTLQWTLMGSKCSPGAKVSPANADSPLSFVFFRRGLSSLGQLSPKTRLGNYLARTNLALLVCKQGKGSRKPALRPTRLCVPRALVSDSHAWPLVWQRPILWDLHGLCLCPVWAKLSDSRELSRPSLGSDPSSFPPQTDPATWANVWPTRPQLHGDLCHWELPGLDRARSTGSLLQEGNSHDLSRTVGGRDPWGAGGGLGEGRD